MRSNFVVLSLINSVLLRVLPESDKKLTEMTRGKRAQLEIILKSLTTNEGGLATLLNITKAVPSPICSKFLEALTKSWDKLNDLRHLTHPLLQKVLLFMMASGKKRVSLFKYLIQ